MKALFTLLFYFCCLASLSAQTTKLPYESYCTQLDYCNDCGDTKAFYKGNLLKYVEKKINWRDIQILNGVVLVELIVDTNGKVCCHALYNYSENSQEEILTLGLDFLFERMSAWQPAILNGKPVLSNFKLALYFNVVGHQHFDIGYLRDDIAKDWRTKSNIDKKLSFDWDESGKKVNKR